MSKREVDQLKIEKKRRREQRVVVEMIRLYCKKKHSNHTGYALCQECQELADYAQMRSEHCPFMEKKTFCSNCKVHCYKPEMRNKIRSVMRYSGPRILLYHPFMALWHVLTSSKEKKQVNNERK